MVGTSDEWPLFPEDAAWEDVQTALEVLEYSDGLPMVPPTLARYEAMVAGRGQPERSFGHVMPLMGDLTLEAAAYNCILAGCRPAELPVVLTAVEASLAEEFNLLGVLSTTGTPAVAVCVHGPAVDRLGLNAGGNTLGPGNRANACIGRAVSLVYRNIGGARAGIGDMATMGSPGKYGFCFAEGSHPTFPPLHGRRGLDAGESAVTVFGVSGTVEVLPAGAWSTPERVLQPIAVAMAAAADVAGAKRDREAGEQVFLLPPEMADVIAEAGWDLTRAQEYLFGIRHAFAFEGENAFDPGPVARSPEAIHPILTGGAGVKMTYLPLWGGGSDSVTRPIRSLPD